jgi:hypothetical protein
MKGNNFPFGGYLINATEEEIVWIRGRAFVVKPATEEDIERVGKGYFALESSESKDELLNT